MMDIFNNPFHILNATSRDDRRRIMDLAEERCLLSDPDDCMNARAYLTNPRKRLAAEIAWLPGVGPKRIEKALASLEKNPASILELENLSPVAKSNLIAAGMLALSSDDPGTYAKWIIALAGSSERIEAEGLLSTINEERIVSGFPKISDRSLIENELLSRRSYYKNCIKNALEKLPSQQLIKAVTIAVEDATDIGEKQGPILIDDLVDSYEVEAKNFLDKESENIEQLVDLIKTVADSDKPDSLLEQKVKQLISVVSNWDTVAQPIQVSTKSRGLDHDSSGQIARTVRELAVYLYNEHGKLGIARMITNMLQEVFAEVVRISELTDADAATLAKLAGENKENQILGPFYRASEKVFKAIETDSSQSLHKAEELIRYVPELLSRLESTTPTPSKKILSKAKDIIAITLLNCAIEYGNTTSKWKGTIPILKKALDYASSTDTINRVKTNMSTATNNIAFDNIEPIDSAPSLSSINGIGFTLYGSSDVEKSVGSYLTTYYFILFFIPIFPIRRYKVIPTPNGYRFFGKAPLRPFDKCHLAISIVLVAWLILSIANS